MSKKKRVPKGNVVWRQSAEEAALAHKPRYNGFACGHGAHGDVKYNRAREKRAWRESVGLKGASRGSLPFSQKLVGVRAVELDVAKGA